MDVQRGGKRVRLKRNGPGFTQAAYIARRATEIYIKRLKQSLQVRALFSPYIDIVTQMTLAEVVFYKPSIIALAGSSRP